MVTNSVIGQILDKMVHFSQKTEGTLHPYPSHHTHIRTMSYMEHVTICASLSTSPYSVELDVCTSLPLPWAVHKWISRTVLSRPVQK